MASPRSTEQQMRLRPTPSAAALEWVFPHPVLRLLRLGRRRQIVGDAVDLIIILLHRKLGVFVRITFLIHECPPICRPSQGHFSLEWIGPGQPRPVLRHPASAGKWCAYNKLSKEQFVSLIEILELSKYLKSPINQRGKARQQLQHGKGKKKRK